MKRLWLLLAALMLAASALAEQREELVFLQKAGIAVNAAQDADSVLTVSLASGGTAEKYLYGDFDPYDLSWMWTDAADEDVALYLDHALGLLHDLERAEGDAWEVQNNAVRVSNSLLDLERTGDQGLRILLSQLSRHEDSPLNSLRARLASRLLGFLDATPVDPSEGLAWYDALVISVQNELPEADASVWEKDEVLAAACQLMMGAEKERRSDFVWTHVDSELARDLVAIVPAEVQLEQDNAKIWGLMDSRRYALYDGSRLRLVTGWQTPVYICMIRRDGDWMLQEVAFAEDGTEYVPSVLRLCRGDKVLQRAVLALQGPDMPQIVRAYLATSGYVHVEEE